MNLTHQEWILVSLVAGAYLCLLSLLIPRKINWLRTLIGTVGFWACIIGGGYYWMTHALDTSAGTKGPAPTQIHGTVFIGCCIAGAIAVCLWLAFKGEPQHKHQE